MEKKKLSLKKETIEVLNQNEMQSLYGGKPIVDPGPPIIPDSYRSECVTIQGAGFCMALTKNCIESIDYCISVAEI